MTILDPCSPGGSDAGPHAGPRRPEQGADRETLPPCARLVRAAARGDHGALAELYDLTSSLVFAAAQRLLHDPGAAEELTVDVYSEAWSKASSYDPARGSVASWLMTITRARAIDRLRSVAARRKHETVPDVLPTDLSSPDPAVDQDLLRVEVRGALRRALDQLPDVQRLVLEATFLHGRKQAEIAVDTGLPLGTVKSHARRGLARMRRLLDAEEL